MNSPAILRCQHMRIDFLVCNKERSSISEADRQEQSDVHKMGSRFEQLIPGVP